MAQVIYTGKGYQAPQSQGRALQALSQYGQQEQGRKTYELETARKDRDKISELMRIDPVYTTNIKAQKRIAKIMDDVLAGMTEFYKKRGGRMSMTDTTELQRMRGEAMAEMGMIKASSDQLTQAYQIAAQKPGVYNERLLNQWRNEWEDSLDNGIGLPPQGPPLVPAFRDPEMLWRDLGQSYRSGARYIKGVEYDYKGREMTPYEMTYPHRAGMTEERLDQMYLNNQGLVSNLIGWFAEKEFNDPQEYDKYMKEANHNEASAAIKWFRDNRSEAFPQSSYTSGELQNKGAFGGRVFYEKGTLFIGNNLAFNTQPNVYISNTKMDEAVVFDRAESKKHPVPVSKSSLILPEGVNISGEDIDGVALAADKNKTYFMVDKNSVNKIRFTKNAMEALRISNSLIEDPETNMFVIKEGAEDDVVLPAKTNEVLSGLNTWTFNRFGDAVNALSNQRNKAEDYDIN